LGVIVGNPPQPAVISTAPLPIGSPVLGERNRHQKPPIPHPAPATVVCNVNGRYGFFHESPLLPTIVQFGLAIKILGGPVFLGKSRATMKNAGYEVRRQHQTDRTDSWHLYSIIVYFMAGCQKDFDARLAGRALSSQNR
jgi:hypothetical protein